MNLTDFTLQSFRILLLPVSLLYGAAVWVRNRLYDHRILSTVSFNLPVICVGNLSVGGTGKSPMIEYLIRMLHADYRLATLSRGYKRKTRGYAIAAEGTTALEIGDEPMQFHLKFPGVAVAVGEERVEAIPQLLQDAPDTEVVLLDDAFQHRSIKPGFSILLTDAGNLFTRDFFLPTGDLRDERGSYRRANVLVGTKFQPALTAGERDRLMRELDPRPEQTVFFASMVYGTPYHILDAEKKQPLRKTAEVLLVTGIANSEPLKRYMLQEVFSYERMPYSDHHIFTIDDLAEIKQAYVRMKGADKLILTTEKDAVRLLKFREQLQELPLYVLPVEHRFLFGEAPAFREQVYRFIRQFKTT